MKKEMHLNVEIPYDEHSWIQKLTLKRSKGDKPVYESSASNIEIIFKNDPNLAGHIWMNDFSGDGVIDNAPWPQPPSKKDAWSDHDDAALRSYFERVYGIRGQSLINDGLLNELSANSRNPQKEWLEGLRWDGVSRVDTAVINYLGAEDNELTRAQTRKWMCAAVARILTPGCKFDNVLMLNGAQGVGKSSFFSILAGVGLHTDSINLRTGDKDTYLALSRAWIVELAELASVKRSSVEEVKGFISATFDAYRRPFERRSQNVPRHCVFCGTTNEDTFLVGNNGNRRFWCIQIVPELRKMGSVPQAMDKLKEERTQIWAEAVHLYKHGETLYLDEKLERMATERQEEMNVSAEDPIKNTLEEYLRSYVPGAWRAMSLAERQAYWQNATDDTIGASSYVRKEVAPEEFVFEYLRLDASDRDVQMRTRRVKEYMVNMGWVRKPNPCRIFGGRFRKYQMPKGWLKDLESDDCL